ncbi:hypothetical protein BSKO_13416 [Bryopsis sp. KO-2023]|nr:hypothetical protein BSKO_13416 [Bryopsis sp. KO-2023]
MRGMLSLVTCFVLLFAADAQQAVVNSQPAQANPAAAVDAVVAPSVVSTPEPAVAQVVAPQQVPAAQPQNVAQPAAVPAAVVTPVPAVVAPAPVVNPAPVVAPAPAVVVPAPAAIPAPVVVPAVTPAPVVVPAVTPAPVVVPAVTPAPVVAPAVTPAPVVAPVVPAAVVAPVPAVVADPVVAPAVPAVADPVVVPEAVPEPVIVVEPPVAAKPAVVAEPPVAVPDPVVVAPEAEDDETVPNLEPDAEVIEKHPYVVSLRRRSDLGYICAGVVIGKKSKHVLTAAHCVDAFLLNGDVMPKVVVGSDSPTKSSGPGVKVLGTAKVDFNPGSSAGRPDLAILTLKKSAKVPPASLPTKRFEPAPESVVTALGWGKPTEGGRRSKKLRAVNMKFVVKDTCELMRGKFIPSFNVCMGGAGAGTCKGDNGGPVVLDGSPDLVVAIVGEDHACGEQVIDVHASVAHAMEWIERVVG